MKRDLQGHYITMSTAGGKAQAFAPAPLPPTPPIEWSSELREKFDQALLALGRLDSVSVLLPDTSLFLYMYVSKEAVLSSMIEGTQSSLSDILLFEFEHQPGVPLDDVQPVEAIKFEMELKGLKIKDLEPMIGKSNRTYEILNHKSPLTLKMIRNMHNDSGIPAESLIKPPQTHV